MSARIVGVPIAVLSIAVSAQPPARRATNIEALLAHSAFYHQRQIIIVGRVATEDNGELRVADDAGSVRVLFKGSAADGLDEIRGEFWDIGRMKPDDPRLAGYDLRGTFHVDPEGAWPRPGDVTTIVATAVTPASPPPAPSIRAIVLNPSRYVEQKVTVTGQFAGRNLFGDLPDAPAKGRYDFVIRSTDAAIWVTGGRPKGKGFDLSVDARIDTGRWLEVTGVLRQGRGLQWLEVGAEGIHLGKAPTETANESEPSIRVRMGPPPEVVFSAPTQDETDVPLTTTVRIQFSRDIDQATLKGHIRVQYVEAQTVEREEPTTPSPPFTTQYSALNRVLELKFAKPLERFRAVNVDLLEGILGTDQQPLKPFTLTFALGGS
jgi:hypothetical protein